MGRDRQAVGRAVGTRVPDTQGAYERSRGRSLLAGRLMAYKLGPHDRDRVSRRLTRTHDPSGFCIMSQPDT